MKYNKNASNSLFSERSAKNKVLIIVPHEDDETIIAGNIIDLLKLNGNDIKVAYLTNGDYSIPAEIRAKEAIHAIRTLGLNEDDVFFLGYPDTQFGENTSLIETTDKPYRSKAGKLETYCCNNFKEFCFQTKGIHHEYIGENVISDLEEIIKFLYPDIIICNDYDKHPDHMTVSYGIDMALDRIIREDINNTYRPLLWKSFAYSLGYFAKDLLKNSNINSTMVPDCDSVSSDFNIINKSIFQWNKRIRIPNSPFNNWNDFVYKQRLFKALACHKSQFAAFRIGRVWRGDAVYWERRTDSVLSNSEYYLNGREVKSLSNFCLYKAKNFSSNGVYVMFMMSICMYMWQFVNKKTEKFFIITIYSLLCINLLLTLSRSIIICTIASQFLILYMMGARKLFKMIFKTIIFIIPILFIVTLFIPALGKTIKYGFLMIAALFDSKVASSISSAFGNDNLMGVGNRFDLYGWVSEKMAGHWLFGHGLYADFSYSFTQSNGFYSWIQTKDSIEVEYLNTLYQFGIFGMMTEVLSFLSVLGLNIKKYSSKLFFEKKISFNKIAFVTLIFYYLQLFAVNQSSDKYVFYIFVMFTIIYNGRVAQEK